MAKPAKRDPYGENSDRLEDGCAWCDECGGDGGGEYCKGFSPSLDGPDYEYVECRACEGTGQVRLDGKPHEDREPTRREIEAAFTCDLDEEIPF